MNSQAENSKCLLLNADYSPIRIISWQRAIVWSMKYENNNDYGIQIIEYYKDKYIQGACNKKYQVPAVAKTLKYFRIHDRKINFSRNNLFIRDNYTCQYCGQQFAISQLTYDHIIPKSRYGNNKNSTHWLNIVTACRPCNHKKGNRTPKEAGMSLINSPIEPNYSYAYLPWYQELSNINQGSSYEIWKPFISHINYV
jgi:5-methylcytosine-specific restriction endonuclease McrA